MIKGKLAWQVSELKTIYLPNKMGFPLLIFLSILAFANIIHKANIKPISSILPLEFTKPRTYHHKW